MTTQDHPAVEPISDEQVSELERMLGQATPGPWEYTGRDESTTWIESASGDVLIHDERGHGHMRENFTWIRTDDAELIVSAVNVLPAMAARIRQDAETIKGLERNRDDFQRLFEETSKNLTRMQDRVQAVTNDYRENDDSRDGYQREFADQVNDALRAALAGGDGDE